MVATTAELPATASDIVRISNAAFTWPGRHPFSLTVEQFALRARESVLLTGPSGSGKSTFLSLLCGILAPQSGRIDILGTDLTALSASARDAFRAEHFGIIFQMFNLLPYGSVVDNVLLPLSFAPKRRQRAQVGTQIGTGVGTGAGTGAEVEAARLLGRLGLEPQLVRGRSAADLSVGQQQRVAAARALIGRPELIVADEPTSALDQDRQVAFLDLLFAETKEAGATLIMVSHDASLARRFDRVLRLDEIAVARHGGAP